MSARFVCTTLIAVLSLAACTRVFFQPSRELALSPEALGLTHREVFFRSADGTTLHGWFFPSRTPTARGTFTQFHGNAENISTHFRSLIWVTQQGYNLFTFDYRGYGRSEGQVSPAGIHEDVVAAIKHARSLTRSQGGGKLILYGQSLGGALLLHAVGTMADREDITLLVADSAFASYQALAREKLASHWLTFILQPLAYMLVSDRYAPARVLGRIAPVPLLVIHGDRDVIVPVHHGQGIYDMAGPPKWLWKLQGVGHIQAMAPEHRQYRTALLSFLEGLADPRQ